MTNPTNMQDYIQLALRTESTDFDAIRERATLEMVDQLFSKAERTIDRAGELDQIKKHLFYGSTMLGFNRDAPTGWDLAANQTRLHHDLLLRLVHAGLGMATEAGEFLQALVQHVFNGEPLDETNLVEEMGDLFWYMAIAADALGVDFAEIQGLNIAKLRTRYPEKFNQADAENRDLDAERNALDCKLQIADCGLNGERPTTTDTATTANPQLNAEALAVENITLRAKLAAAERDLAGEALLTWYSPDGDAMVADSILRTPDGTPERYRIAAIACGEDGFSYHLGDSDASLVYPDTSHCGHFHGTVDAARTEAEAREREIRENLEDFDDLLEWNDNDADGTIEASSQIVDDEEGLGCRYRITPSPLLGDFHFSLTADDELNLTADHYPTVADAKAAALNAERNARLDCESSDCKLQIADCGLNSERPTTSDTAPPSSPSNPQCEIRNSQSEIARLRERLVTLGKIVGLQAANGVVFDLAAVQSMCDLTHEFVADADATAPPSNPQSPSTSSGGTTICNLQSE